MTQNNEKVTKKLWKKTMIEITLCTRCGDVVRVVETQNFASLPGLQPFFRFPALGVRQADGRKRVVVDHVLVDLE